MIKRFSMLLLFQALVCTGALCECNGAKQFLEGMPQQRQKAFCRALGRGIKAQVEADWSTAYAVLLPERKKYVGTVEQYVVAQQARRESWRLIGFKVLRLDYPVDSSPATANTFGVLGCTEIRTREGKRVYVEGYTMLYLVSGKWYSDTVEVADYVDEANRCK